MADKLKKLHTALIDTRNGYEEALKDTKDPQVAEMARKMIALRNADHKPLHKSLVDAGEKPDDKGSFMTTVHETVIAARSAIAGLGKDSMSAFISGEKNIVKEYDDAIHEAKSDTPLRNILTAQKQNLMLKIQEMEKIKA
jgi:uncharacterized protein (TIGR02284 family)